ncbi:hypothetical protein CBR_g47998 [Chara braunii]|uniref:Reverse transcriptase domain-containing protein n=1 Tax=Chara braunii TaxID=69332 RepID=A0A388M1R9_CHABU|nr:hypothetical protein CBR_g47998 [Chara braunii]|eukprot:GBG88528.1 hypothetical protein CBR_g47998 [Chara braunii]
MAGETKKKKKKMPSSSLSHLQVTAAVLTVVVVPVQVAGMEHSYSAQHAMNRIFHDYLDKFIVVYLDDILIFSRPVEEHAEHLKTVLGLLRQDQYKVNLEKCEFGRTKILYLGHEISADGSRPDDAKVASIRDWPRPQTVIEVRSFLGMTDYYRLFVKNYSTIASPLTDLTRLDTPWEWAEECEAAFRKLKYALTHYEVLKLPDPDKPFVVTTDAIQYGIGAVLAQKEGPKLRPIEYMSKKMPSQKLAKSTYERELYALYRALVVPPVSEEDISKSGGSREAALRSAEASASTYTLQVFRRADELSVDARICTLGSIAASNAQLNPKFSPSTFFYEVEAKFEAEELNAMAIFPNEVQGKYVFAVDDPVLTTAAAAAVTTGPEVLTVAFTTSDPAAHRLYINYGGQHWREADKEGMFPIIPLSQDSTDVFIQSVATDQGHNCTYGMRINRNLQRAQVEIDILVKERERKAFGDRLFENYRPIELPGGQVNIYYRDALDHCHGAPYPWVPLLGPRDASSFSWPLSLNAVNSSAVWKNGSLLWGNDSAFRVDNVLLARNGSALSENTAVLGNTTAFASANDSSNTTLNEAVDDLQVPVSTNTNSTGDLSRGNASLGRVEQPTSSSLDQQSFLRLYQSKKEIPHATKQHDKSRFKFLWSALGTRWDWGKGGARDQGESMGHEEEEEEEAAAASFGEEQNKSETGGGGEADNQHAYDKKTLMHEGDWRRRHLLRARKGLDELVRQGCTTALQVGEFNEHGLATTLAPQEQEVGLCLQNILNCEMIPSEVVIILDMLFMSQLMNKKVACITINAVNGDCITDGSAVLHSSCAVVGNGPSVGRSDTNGEAIDRHDAVFRVNFAPKKFFESYVGNKTTYRVLDDSTANEIARGRRAHPDPGETWVLSDQHSVHVGTRRLHLWEWDAMFVMMRETTRLGLSGKTRTSATGEPDGREFICPRTISTGLQTVLLALRLCQEVNLFGFSYTEHMAEKGMRYFDDSNVDRDPMFTAHNWQFEALFLRILHLANRGIICTG